jgi:acyl-CoA synthetase (NDP forming)
MGGDIDNLFLSARQAGRRHLSERDSKRVVEAFGVSVPRAAMVGDCGGVAAAVQDIPGPYVVKIVSPDVLHKTEFGGVAVGLTGKDDVKRAIERMAERATARKIHVEGFIVEAMQPAGVELVVGAMHDRQFGPMLMAGIGGIFVEVLRDVAFRICPIMERDAASMLRELKGSALLDGTRGLRPVDREALIATLMKIGGPDGLMMRLANEVAELDINPIIAAGRDIVAVDARIILSDTPREEVRAKRAVADEQELVARFGPLVNPSSVAVLGASANGTTIANTFIRRLKKFGYAGSIYPIHLTAEAIEGLPCFRSVAETPDPIDYAYIAISAKNIPEVLQAAHGRLRFAQVISSGFGEVADGVDLEAELVAKAHEGGCRVIGPNCLGMYSPRGGMTFPEDAPREAGHIGVICQSGGLGTDIIKRGSQHGLRFSSVFTVGNCADLTPVDLVEYLFADPDTKVIGLYLEGAKDGRAFFEVLRRNASRKPVVILWGGRSKQGSLAAASHTGAIAGNHDAWRALSQQTGCVLVSTLDQFIDVLLAFQCLSPRKRHPTQNVVLFGNGGGTSVLAVDAFAERGLSVLPFGDALKAKLAAMKLPPGTSVANPIDAPVATLQQEDGRIAKAMLDVVYEGNVADAVVVHINLAAFVGRGDADPVDNLIDGALQTHANHGATAHFAVVLRVDGSRELDDRSRRYRQNALQRGIPVYDELVNAADALRGVSFVERYLATT